jgi:hypothetical protein
MMQFVMCIQWVLYFLYCNLFINYRLTGRPVFTGKTYNTIVKQNKEANIDYNALENVSENAKNLIF